MRPPGREEWRASAAEHVGAAAGERDATRANGVEDAGVATGEEGAVVAGL